MPLSMHQASAPVFLRALANLRHVLALGETDALARFRSRACLIRAGKPPTQGCR